ncbi:MAG: DUF2892 domain-containing protein, partial [Actinomycetota bacterium]
GKLDRIIRILVGIALIVWAITGGPAWAWIGLVPLATGFWKFCPVYRLLGINSCGDKK